MQKIFLLHPYKEQPNDTVSKQLYPDGSLHLYIALKDDKPANGWSNKKYYPNAALQQEENYSNGLLIEKITYDETGAITKHKIWNNRLKQLIDKPAAPKLQRPNVVVGCSSISDFLQQLPSISEFIVANFDKDSLSRSYDEETEWKMKGEQMSFTIYWDKDEVSHQWHCHCATEELYWQAREFLESKL
jgi:hypothetical protein